MLDKTTGDVETKREQILNAALKLFAKQGVAATSTSDIAREAGVAQALLYYHFKSKEELWQTSVQQASGRLRDEIHMNAEALDDLSNAQRLKVILRQYAFFVVRHPEVHKVLLFEAMRAPKNLAFLVRDPNSLMRGLYRAIQTGMREGWIRDISPVHAVFAIAGAAAHICDWAEVVKVGFGVDMRDPREQEKQVDTFMKLVVGGLFVETE